MGLFPGSSKALFPARSAPPDLHPCPLCGGPAYATRTVNGTQMLHVGCAPCGLELKAAWYRDQDAPTKDIVSLWNTRAESAAPALPRSAPPALTTKDIADIVVAIARDSNLDDARDQELCRKVQLLAAALSAAEGARAQLVQDLRQETNQRAELEAVIAAVTAAVAGWAVSDFMESFGPVRSVLDLKASRDALTQQLTAARAAGDISAAGHSAFATEMDGVRRELARHLSPENQNVVNADAIGMARDLAQVKVTSMGNAIEAMRQLEVAEERLRETREPKEICICAAIITEDGRIFRGHRHNDALAVAGAIGLKQRSGHENQGFITSRNRYVDRKEGCQLQRAAGIDSVSDLPYLHDELYSEDLY